MDERKLENIKKLIQKNESQDTSKVLSFRVDGETYNQLEKILAKGKIKSKSKFLKLIVTNEINKIFNK